MAGLGNIDTRKFETPQGKPSMSATAVPCQIREKFERLAAQWKNESRFLSNTVQIATLDSYQRIIGIGEPAVPLILEALEREPDPWFWALQAITEEDPAPPEAHGKPREMARAWIEWGRARGLVAA
jgi:hypothetical protein